MGEGWGSCCPTPCNVGTEGDPPTLRDSHLVTRCSLGFSQNGYGQKQRHFVCWGRPRSPTKRNGMLLPGAGSGQFVSGGRPRPPTQNSGISLKVAGPGLRRNRAAFCQRGPAQATDDSKRHSVNGGRLRPPTKNKGVWSTWAGHGSRQKATAFRQREQTLAPDDKQRHFANGGLPRLLGEKQRGAGPGPPKQKTASL